MEEEDISEFQVLSMNISDSNQKKNIVDLELDHSQLSQDGEAAYSRISPNDYVIAVK